VFFDSNGNLVPGTLTATLDLWARPLGADQPIKVDSFSFGIGSDFWLAVPQAVIDSHASWEDTIPPGNSPYGDWVLAEPGLSGVSLFPFGFFSGLDTDVALLADWCATPQVAGGQDLAFVNGIFVMALRGDCVFSQKVTNIEASYAVGALIVNDSENGGASTISLGTLNPGIPAITLSYQRGEQIIALEQTHNIVYIDFDARWDPDPSAVPEPATLMLVSGGLALAAAPRLRRRRERLPREPHT
jgi:hypothetical protein